MLAGGNGLGRGQEPGTGFGALRFVPGWVPSLVGNVGCGCIIGTEDLQNILIMRG